MTRLEAGQRAPAFTLVDQHGGKVKLTDYRGRRVVVYFYPKANTSGCTTQSCALRDAEPELDELGADIIGISPDAPDAQLRFDEQHELGFPLLSDPKHTVADKYGVWGTKKLYGKESRGIIRSAFVVDEQGKLAGVFYKVSPKDTVPKVRETLEEL